MGKNNRQRRAQKKRRQSRPGADGGPRRGPGQADEPLPPTIEHLWTELNQVIAALWKDGWQPVDVVRILDRKLDGSARALVLDAVAYEARSYRNAPHADPSWTAQLDDMQAAVWWDDRLPFLRQFQARHDLRPADLLRSFERVGAVLFRLPPLPRLGPGPSEWGTTRVAARSGAVDPKMLERVRGLLAKAESTDFPEEAEALTAKAQELMAKHAIDLIVVAGPTPGEGPIQRRVGIDDPYATAKMQLLHEVGEANRCRVVGSRDLGFATLLGYEGDIEATEMLFTSLLVQATTAMLAQGSKRDPSGRSRTRSFRQSFLFAFAVRIGDRLRAATADVVNAAVAEHGSLLPVLVSRQDAVDDLVDATFGRLRRTTVSASNAEGWVAGEQAADRAHLGGSGEVPWRASA